MTTPNNAAALERLENELREELRNSQYVVELSVEAVSRWANELATLRATLAQPDALTSQPSGEVVAARLTVYADTTAITARIHDVAHCLAPGTYDLYTHPSADAPGAPVQACKHKWRDSDRADPMLPCAWVQQCTKCGAYEDDN